MEEILMEYDRGNNVEDKIYKARQKMKEASKEYKILQKKKQIFANYCIQKLIGIICIFVCGLLASSKLFYDPMINKVDVGYLIIPVVIGLFFIFTRKRIIKIDKIKHWCLYLKFKQK